MQSLLLRLGINGRVSENLGKGRPQFQVTVSGGAEIVNFLETVGALGANKRRSASAILEYFDGRTKNPNRT